MAEKARIAIVTDSTSDLTPGTQERYGITVVPLNVHFSQETFRDQVDLTTDEFMARLASAPKLPTTSQPSVGLFEETFRRLANDYDEIVCVLISSRLSGTVQSATLAAEAVAGVIHVEVVDSQNCTYGLGFQAIHAVELTGTAHSAAEIAAQLVSELNAYHVVFFVDTLEHLQRGGRIGKAAQLVGTLLQLKPLLRVDGGQVVPFERTRTRSKAMAALVSFARDISNIDRIAVIYNTTPDDAARLAEQIAPLVNGDEIPSIQFGPVIAAHIGPNAVGLAIRESING